MGKKLATGLLSQVDRPGVEKKLNKSARRGPRKGEKSKPWDEDPLILRDLETVTGMMLRGAKLWQIAEALGYSLVTAMRDKQRVQELWRREAGDAVVTKRDRSIAHLRYLQMQAWAQWEKGKDVTYLREVRACEAEIITLEGTETPVDQTVRIAGDERPFQYLSDSELAALVGASRTATADRRRGKGRTRKARVSTSPPD